VEKWGYDHWWDSFRRIYSTVLNTQSWQPLALFIHFPNFAPNPHRGAVLASCLNGSGLDFPGPAPPKVTPQTHVLLDPGDFFDCIKRQLGFSIHLLVSDLAPSSRI
jgi:hypothetical protein